MYFALYFIHMSKPSWRIWYAFWYGALCSLFASAHTLLEEGHVRVDVAYAAFSEKTKGKVNVVGSILLGLLLCWTILIIGMAGKSSIINAPVFNFEVTQSGYGLYVKYLMAAFLGIFAISMMIQFVSYMFGAVADCAQRTGQTDCCRNIILLKPTL